MVKACRDTWASTKTDNIKFYYCYGHRKGIRFPKNSDTIKSFETYWPNGGPRIGGKPQSIRQKKSPFAIGDCIYSDTPEGRENIYYKTMDAFQWLVENEEFDYLLRTNCGTYVDMELLLEYIKNLEEKENIYCGWPMEHNNSHNKNQPSKIKFASGSAFLASKNLISDIVKNRESVDVVRGSWLSKTIIDDVTFGHRFINKNNATYRNWTTKVLTVKHEIGPDVGRFIQVYFGHTINPELIYATHRAKLISRSTNK
jgi:hypothetical protein